MNVARNRPQRPAAPQLPPFDALDRTHHRVLELLDEFDRLLDHVEANGPDEPARELARGIHRFFADHAREHHAAEEKHVFPVLLASGNPEIVQHVLRLQQDHGWLELAPQIEAIGQGYNWYDLAMLRQALPVFRTLYEEHIALEESMIYPAAKRHQADLAAGSAARQGG
jgi:hemerythrin-like domain-containing protein